MDHCKQVYACIATLSASPLTSCTSPPPLCLLCSRFGDMFGASAVGWNCHSRFPTAQYAQVSILTSVINQTQLSKLQNHTVGAVTDCALEASHSDGHDMQSTCNHAWSLHVTAKNSKVNEYKQVVMTACVVFRRHCSR